MTSAPLLPQIQTCLPTKNPKTTPGIDDRICVLRPLNTKTCTQALPSSDSAKCNPHSAQPHQAAHACSNPQAMPKTVTLQWQMHHRSPYYDSVSCGSCANVASSRHAERQQRFSQACDNPRVHRGELLQSNGVAAINCKKRLQAADSAA